MKPLPSPRLGPDSGQFEGEATLSETNNYHILQVSEGDLLVVRYIDADDGQGGRMGGSDRYRPDRLHPPRNLERLPQLNIEPRSATIQV